MPLLHLETLGEVAIISMNRPPGNALSLELIDELTATHHKLAADDSVRAVLLCSGLPGYFCEGLDLDQLSGALPSLYGTVEGLACGKPNRSVQEGPHEAKRLLFERFFEMIYELYAFPKLQFTLIEGHAIAGGAVLAMLSDFRAMSDAPGRFQFSELKLGLGIPPVLAKLVSQATARPLNRALLAAEAFKAKGAHEAGLVDMIFEPQRAKSASLFYIKRVLEAPDGAFQATKAAIRAPLLASWRDTKEETLSFIEQFFTEDFDKQLRKIRERRGRRG